MVPHRLRFCGVNARIPKARVICCVRDIPWIFDSIERLIRKNMFQPSGIFGFEPGGNVYSRVNGMVGYSWNALHEAWCGEQSDRLLLVTYETLTNRPREAIDAIYEFIGDARQERFDFLGYSRGAGLAGRLCTLMCCVSSTHVSFVSAVACMDLGANRGT